MTTVSNLPSTLEGFRDLHRGETILVCGCGTSLNELKSPERFITIGVNDVGRLFHPTYLVVLNPKRQFSGDRFLYVESSRSLALFTQLDLSVQHPHIVRIRLGDRSGTDPAKYADRLHYARNSPYVALQLALYMGATRIGMIGVDFTDHHFFARSGRHALAGSLPEIDAEYHRVAETARRRGIEIVNLGINSRLTAFPKIGIQDWLRDESAPAVSFHARETSVFSCRPSLHSTMKVFGVEYRFLACGDVFSVGLRNGAEQLGVRYESALWNDPMLVAKIEQFQPDLIFVVHGRKFVQRWGRRLTHYQTAVWLLDEPYEVDDTARWSSLFNTVFVNDPNTISRHRNAHYLPVCFNPRVHRELELTRSHRVGFVGGYNETRERYLRQAADAGFLSYVIGGSWTYPGLRRLCLGTNVPPEKTTQLYQQTQVVLNVFRDKHHYNRQNIPARSMNPRIYEALACGALVLSERRPEILEVFPELPVFDDTGSLVRMLDSLLTDESHRKHLWEKNRARLEGHAYSDRLEQVLRTCLEKGKLVAHRNTAAEEPIAIEGVEMAEARTRAELKTINLTDLSRAHSDSHAKTARRKTVKFDRDSDRTAKSGSPRPGHGLWPFTGMPRRHLVYHIWPVRGSLWSWNLDQLKSRLDLFNGRRILGIVHDQRAEPPERIQEYLEGEGFEFIVTQNDQRGEAITFPLMMERLASDEADEVTLYAHAKGVKYEPHIPSPVKRWAEVLYRVALDDWLTVREQLQRFAMTGPFKMLGRFTSHRHLADWHYSGTFFWMRNAQILPRKNIKVPQFYGGVETWPGMMFRKEETGCLFMDKLRQLPYHEQFWRTAGEPAFKMWESRLRHFPPPADLVHPRPYKGYTEPRMEQKPEEFEWWVDLLLKQNVVRVLTIGSKHGGVEWHLAREFFEHGRKIDITAIERDPAPQLQPTLHDAESRFRQSLRLVTTDSTSPGVRGRLADQYDAVFIDGDHSYKVSRSDFTLAKALNARLIGLHDIVDSDWHAYARCCVSRLWAELSREYRTDHKSSAEWGGIGVVRFDGA